MKQVTYPQFEQPEVENELNYLAKIYTQAYLAFRRGEITEQEFELIDNAIELQKKFFIEQ